MATPTTPAAASHPTLIKAGKLAGLLTLLLAAVAGVVVYRRARSAQPPAPTLRMENQPVTRGPLQARITASGTLSPLISVQVGSQVSGRIQALLVDFNSVVKKGQLVARIDPELFKAAWNQSQANLLAAEGNSAKVQAQLEDAERQAKRSRDLRAESLIAQADADTAETNLLVARAGLKAAQGAEAQARASLEQARTNLAYTTIVSPIDGVVISRNVDVGQTVAATLQSPTLFVIAQDLKTMQVDTSVAEADVGRLRAGMSATFTVDAYPGQTFKGVIREVRNAPQTVQNVVTYDSVIDVDNSDLLLKPGMTANVTVVYADRAEALRVPNAALRFRAPPEMIAKGGPPPTLGATDQRTVWLLQGGEARPVAVKVGVSDGTNTEVLGGLQLGDSVVTEAVSASKSGPGSFGRVF
jgi:HlyD family secretion protein